MRLPLDEVREDPRLQLRDGLDMDRVKAMVEFEEEGGQLPPIDVVGDDNLLADGHHRLAAARRSGRADIAVTKHEGGDAEAIAIAIQRNDTAAGQPLTRTQRNQGIKALLKAEWSQERIAKVTGVHQTTIMNIDNALAMRGEVTKRTEPSRGKAGGRVPKPVTTLTPDVAERLNDTTLVRIADSVPLEDQQEFAAAVAQAELPEPRVREAIRAMKEDHVSPTEAVAAVTPARMVMPATMPEVAKQARRRLERFLEEPMTVEKQPRDFWAVLDVLAANAEGIPLEAGSLSRLLAEVAVKADHYATALRSTEALAEVGS